METINNTEPMPHTPQGANGQWMWDGHTTSKHRSVDGSEWLLKGAWRWVQQQKKVQAPQAKQPIAMIAKQFKPTLNENHKIEKAFNALFILGGSITLITLLILTAL
jgi:hypothetical protein